MPDDTLTGARLVDAVADALWKRAQPENPNNATDDARAALRAQAEAAGVDADGLRVSADILHGHPLRRNVAALLRALSEVLRDE